MDIVAKYEEFLESEKKKVTRYGTDVLSLNKAVTADY